MGKLLVGFYFTTLCFAQQALWWDADRPSSWELRPTDVSSLSGLKNNLSFQVK